MVEAKVQVEILEDNRDANALATGPVWNFERESVASLPWIDTVMSYNCMTLFSMAFIIGVTSPRRSSEISKKDGREPIMAQLS